ncbi:MAG: hypothetical protein J6I55_01965 [Ruminococcus sp.]|nr:hypothetical protein [Ruminococcus sp.]
MPVVCGCEVRGRQWIKGEHGYFAGSIGTGEGGSSGGAKVEKGLDKSEKDDIINITSNAHSRDIELEEVISKCINQEKPVFADDLAKYFSNIPPEKGKYIMSLHGNANETYIYGHKIDARILANIIKSRKDYNGKDEIVLISCNTGNQSVNKNCFAQQLANILNKTVHAPTKYGAISIFGTYYSSNSKGMKDGEFKSFNPEVQK